MPETTPRAEPPNAALNPDDAGALEQRLKTALAPALQLVRPIGSGGMAHVFLAREPALKRLVAVKVLSGEQAASAESRARFEREAQAVASLSHPNIVAIHSVGELDDGTPYFVMQYVEGRSMAARVASDGPLGVREARRMLGEVAAALSAAHVQGITHRDIKPANILYEEATGRALVSDFGIAAMTAGSAVPAPMRLTGTGMIVGTPQYMSPEQLLAEPVTEKTDVYSLGLLAHELLVGEGPFRASSPHELIAAHLRDTPARLSTLRAEVDSELDEIVARCLDKNASKRPTAEDVARRLAPGGAALLEWPPPGLDEIHGALRRMSVPLALGAGLCLGVAVSVSEMGPSMSVSSFTALVLMVVAVLGVVLLIEGLRRAERIGLRVVRAVREGYSWMTILETMSDTRRDTGSVITGSREYAALTPAERVRVRVKRLIREMVPLLAGLLALPLFLFDASLASDRAEPRMLWLAPFVYVVLVLGALILWSREEHAFARHRTRRTKRVLDVARLSPVWYESFEQAREGQSLGRGKSGSALTARVAGIFAVTLVIVGAFLFMPIVTIGTLGPRAINAGTYTNAVSRGQVASAMRPMALPRDSAISPLAAGRALYSILSSDKRNVQGRIAELPVPHQMPVWPWADSIPPGLFPTSRSPRQYLSIPEHTRILNASRRGFSAAELAYLERMARMPQWALWDSLARARGMDHRAARYRYPLDSTVVAGWWSFDVPRYNALRALSHASASRAAYHIARGRRDSAETVLRQSLAAGFTMMDYGSITMDYFMGVAIVTVARTALLNFYEITGDARASSLNAAHLAATASVEVQLERENALLRAGSVAQDPRVVREYLLSLARDSSMPLSLRMEVLHWLSVTPCTNLRELIFGHADDVRESFDSVLKSARYASDTAQVELIRATPERFYRYAVESKADVPLMGFVGRVLGNPRLAGCMSLVLQ